MAGEPDHNFVKIKDAIDRGIRVFFIELENDRQDELMYEFLIEVNCEGTSIEIDRKRDRIRNEKACN
jgi:hypothetical protein